MTGVYGIRNLTNQKMYIGGTTQTFEKRWSIHRLQLTKGNHHSVHLQRAWNKYGPAQFVFEVIEECNMLEVATREQHYLDTLLYASENDDRFHVLGYNVKRRSQVVPGIHSGSLHPQTKLTDEMVRAIKLYLASSWYSQSEVAEIFDVSQRAISDIKTGKRWSNIKFSVS